MAVKNSGGTGSGKKSSNMHTSDEMAARRRDEALKRALRTPPKPHKREKDEGRDSSRERATDKKQD